MGPSFSRRRPATFTNINDAAVVGVPVANVVAGDQPPAAQQPPPPLSATSTLSLTMSSEKSALAYGVEHKMLAMVSLRAPTFLAHQEERRPPMDLVVAADRSGSMSGEKMRLMKTTLENLVLRSGLNEDDRISLVSFDSEVRLELPLECMDTAGRQKALGVVRRLQPGSTTNLSGGALKAIDVLDASAAPVGNKAADTKRTRSVLLFTDGLANVGIRDPAQLTAAVSGALTAAAAKLGGPISLFTFGFGSDHNENCLRTLAANSGTGGLYYYVSSAEDIPNAFADCLGGLTSVVAQNATLSLSVDSESGASLSRVLGSTYTLADGAISLGDLYSEDQKDVLVELTLPTRDGPTGPTTVLRAALRAFNVVISAPDVAEASLDVARPEETPGGQPVNTALDAQRNRIETAEAMERATRLADGGDIAGGRFILEGMRRKVADSASASHALSLDLVEQCDELAVNYRSDSVYRAVGSKMSKMQATSHSRQRGNHHTPSMYTAGAKRKAAMKMSWAMTTPAGKDGGDSD